MCVKYNVCIHVCTCTCVYMYDCLHVEVCLYLNIHVHLCVYRRLFRKNLKICWVVGGGVKREFERLEGYVTYRVIVVCILTNKFQGGWGSECPPPPAFVNKTLVCTCMYMPVCVCDYVQLYIYMYVFMYTCTVVHVCSVLPRAARQALLIHQNHF